MCSFTYYSQFKGCDYCEDDGGECYFNTLVVFNNLGAIIAVYHKFNLWTSELTHFNIDESPQVFKQQTSCCKSQLDFLQLVSFETEDMGTFGLAVCADLMWR